MPVVLGAPNVLLGGSHSGNASAEELIALGYCTGLASDYAPSTLLAAAFDLARRDVVGFTAAVALITSGPAAAIGLSDHGRLEPGCVADLVLVEQDGRWPRVVCVLTSPCGLQVPRDAPSASCCSFLIAGKPKPVQCQPKSGQMRRRRSTRPRVARACLQDDRRAPLRWARIESAPRVSRGARARG